MHVCYISLGGNLGRVGNSFAMALDILREHPQIRVSKIGSIIETAAVGSNAGGNFLNAAAEIETSLGPEALLDVLQDVEQRLGRTREIHWGPRTLDLDLLFYGLDRINTSRLVVPHPAAWYRRFVLDPLAEIAPDFVHPEKLVTIAELRSRLDARNPEISFAGGTAECRAALIARLRSEFARVKFSDWNESKAVRRPPAEPTFLVWLGVGGGVTFEELPLLPRVDATVSVDAPDEFVRHLIQSAGVQP